MKSLVILLGLLIITQAWAKSKSKNEENEVVDEEDADHGGYKRQMEEDPCYSHHCSIGKECDIDDDGKPICVCARKCVKEEHERAKTELQVCSTSNSTFDSLCEMHRQKCICHHKPRFCEETAYKHLKLDYYGPCKEMKPCTDFEMEEYPLRMREWLFLTMEELASRKELSESAEVLAKEALEQQKKWVIPVVWKFCELDSTHDLSIDWDELLPITAPLKPLEHCTEPFLHKCDQNKDDNITLKEWSLCLGLEEDEIQDKCDLLY